MKLTFDYTDQTTPLTLDQIKDDCDSLYARNLAEPDKIVLWEYQLDWLIKSIEKLEIGPVAKQLRDGVKLWSYPLEIRTV